jgi:hypothetical protein
MAIGYFGKATVRKPENSALFLDRAGKVLELAKSWSQPELWPKTQMLQWLGQLVEGVNSLRQIKKFEEIMLDFIPNKEMGESQRLHLLNMVLKVARYREAARWILRIAIQFPLVRHMRVIAVELPYEAFERLPPDREYRSSIQSTISRLQGLESTHRDIGEMCDLLGVSTEEANIQYTEQVNKTLQKSKIHAEIQLFYHCQTRLRGQKLLPRVIRSSKSACWLCNAFLLLHSNIYTPRCHGRLYPGWRLPALHGDWCGDIEARFNQCLERQLADSIRNLHSRRKRCSNCPPMESDLSIITWMSSGWSNTKPTITIAENENVREEAPALILDAPMVLESDPRPDPEIAVAEASIEFSEILYNRSSTELLSTVTIGDPKHNSTPSGSRLHGTHHILTAQTAEPSPKETHPVAEVASTEVWVEDSESLDSSVSMGSASAAAASRESHSFTTSESILQEAQDNIRSNSVVQGKASKLYDLGPMQFQIEYASNPGQKLQGDGPSRQLSCTMEWLSPEHVESLRLEGRDLIDAESLTEQEISRSLDMSNSIYLSVKEAVLRVMMQPVS